jgi:hypothetical protein
MLTTCWISTSIYFCGLQLWQQVIVQTPVCSVTCHVVVWNNILETHQINTHQKTRTDTALAVARGLVLVNFLLESMTVWLWHRPFSLRTGLEKSQDMLCVNSNTSLPSHKNRNNYINETKLSSADNNLMIKKLTSRPSDLFLKLYNDDDDDDDNNNTNNNNIAQQCTKPT